MSHLATVHANMVGVDLSVEKVLHTHCEFEAVYNARTLSMLCTFTFLQLCVHLGVCMGTAPHPTTVPVINITKVLGVIKVNIIISSQSHFNNTKEDVLYQRGLGWSTDCWAARQR